MTTLNQGKPYGPALISYTHPGDEYLSFDGVGIFTDGKLHGGPFTFIRGNKVPQSFVSMKDGRPEDGQYGTKFNCIIASLPDTLAPQIHQL